MFSGAFAFSVCSAANFEGIYSNFSRKLDSAYYFFGKPFFLKERFIYKLKITY